MNLPLALPRPVSSAGFTLETRRLLTRLPGEKGLWVMKSTAVELQTARGPSVPRLRDSGSPLRSDKPLPYPSGGGTQAARLAHYFLLAALLRGERALFLDAANCFNPHRLAEMIRRVNERRQGALRQAQDLRCAPTRPCPTQAAEELLARVRLSRAFTCFQLAELVERVPRCAGRWGARCVFLTGVPEIFDDEELNAAEARRVFGRALAGMRRWRHGRVAVLVFTATYARPRTSYHRLAAQLERAADGIYRFEETPHGLAVREGEKFPALCAPSATSTSLR